MKYIYLYLAFLIFAHQAEASSFENGVSLYDETQRSSKMYSSQLNASTQSIFEGKGHSSGIGLGYTRKEIHLKNPNKDLATRQLGGKTDTHEDSYNLNLDQGLGIGTQIGGSVGVTTSDLVDRLWWSANFMQWFLEETLQTTLSLRKTITKAPQIDTVDVDVRRIRTPEEIVGTNAKFGMTHLTTPSTILRGQYSLTKRNDRPDAFSVMAEVRQFISLTETAVHLNLTHFENVGEIKPITTYGTVVANAVSTELHQHIPGRVITMLGYRQYREIENPRAIELDRKQLGSDWIYSSIRYRFGEKPMTEDDHEAYIFGGRYLTNQNINASVIGLGVKFTF